MHLDRALLGLNIEGMLLHISTVGKIYLFNKYSRKNKTLNTWLPSIKKFSLTLNGGNLIQFSNLRVGSEISCLT